MLKKYKRIPQRWEEISNKWGERVENEKEDYLEEGEIYNDHQCEIFPLAITSSIDHEQSALVINEPEIYVNPLTMVTG